MDAYADSLAACLQGSRFRVKQYLPRSSLERFSANRFVMRYLRYVDYPRQVRNRSTNIHHVIDHGYAHLYPRLGSGLKCITVHDLIPLLNWKGHIKEVGSDLKSSSSVKKPLLNIHSLSYLSNFDQIISNSDCTAKDIIQHLGIDKHKIKVIPPVIEERFKPLDKLQIAEFAQRYKLETDCKWIMISGQQFYKNHTTCLKVLKKLSRYQDRKIRLIKTGHYSDDFHDQAVSMGLSQYVSQISVNDREDLPKLFNFVDCLLFPSLYEGFGMPVAESLACGTPVVTSDRGAIPEVAGSLAPQINPFDVNSLATEVYKMIFEKDKQASILKTGPFWVNQFRERVVSGQLESLYDSMLVATKS